MSTVAQMQKARIWETMQCNKMPVQASLITGGFISLGMLAEK